MPDYTLRVNGASRTVRTDADTPLLYVLRNDFELNGAKFGCGLAQCGACTVQIDGRAARSCVTPVSSLAGKAVTTLEGIGTLDKLHPLQNFEAKRRHRRRFQSRRPRGHRAAGRTRAIARQP